ncbi:MAG: hypothetical protein GY773_00230 [Actinomycetia bacterium]|nr:hypothetical protein [Actinomycetes bacterium]
MTIEPWQMDQPELALIDGDLLANRVAFVAKDDDEIPFSTQQIMKNWMPPGCTRLRVALSCSREDNYRRDHYPGYKTNRDSSSLPDDQIRRLGLAKALLEENYDIAFVPRMEADDLMGVAASSGKAVAVTLDKDLTSCPGWHYRPSFSYWGGADEDGIKYQITKPALLHRVSRHEADLQFHEQWLAGDPTDGFAGIRGIGRGKANKYLKDLPPRLWTAACLALYEAKGYDLEYAEGMAHCARILRVEDWEMGYTPHS